MVLPIILKGIELNMYVCMVNVLQFLLDVQLG